MVASAENVLKSTENNSKSCEKPLNGRRDTVFLHTYLTEASQMGKSPQELKKLEELRQQPLWLHSFKLFLFIMNVLCLAINLCSKL